MGAAIYAKWGTRARVCGRRFVYAEGAVSGMGARRPPLFRSVAVVRADLSLVSSFLGRSGRRSRATGVSPVVSPGGDIKVGEDRNRLWGIHTGRSMRNIPYVYVYSISAEMSGRRESRNMAPRRAVPNTTTTFATHRRNPDARIAISPTRPLIAGTSRRWPDSGPPRELRALTKFGSRPMTVLR